MIRGVRGATTIKENRESEIVDETERLLRKMVTENSIEPDRVASVLISVTNDITATFPARALRRLDGWTYVPVMCMREIPVPQSLPYCIRVMMHVNTSIPQKDISHIYLNDAIVLRPDLKKQNKEV